MLDNLRKEFVRSAGVAQQLLTKTVEPSINPVTCLVLLYAARSLPVGLGVFLAGLVLHSIVTWTSPVDLKKGKIIIRFPMFVYDAVAMVLWPMNYLINALPYFQPLSPDWDEDRHYSQERMAERQNAASPSDLEELKTRIIKQKDVRFDEMDVVQLFDTLEPITPEMLLEKTWDGHVLRTTSVLDLAEYMLVRPLQMLGFGWGKRYRSRNVGDPLLVNWLKLIYFPLPAWGNVSMVNMSFRGRDQATMRYCHQPWNDHFRILDDGSASGKVVLLGVWCAREKNGGWFTLTHDPSVVTTAR